MNFINSCKIHESSSRCYLYLILGLVERSNHTIEECIKKDNGLTRRLGACSAQCFICSVNSKTQLYWFVTLQDPVSKRPCITFPIHGPGKSWMAK